MPLVLQGFHQQPLGSFDRDPDDRYRPSRSCSALQPGDIVG